MARTVALSDDKCEAMAALWITERCDRQAAATMLRTMRGGVLEVWAAATAAAGKKALSRCLVAAVAGRFDSQDQREGIDISLVERMADSPTSQPPQVLTTIVSWLEGLGGRFLPPPYRRPDSRSTCVSAALH